MKKLYMVIIVFSFFITGCIAEHDAAYYSAVQKQTESYMAAYSGVENESVKFEGTFTGTISVIKPKELPKLQHIEKPKTVNDALLEWAHVLVPAASVVAGMHYNYMSADSSNKYNAENIKSWTGNFDKTNTSNTITNNSVTDVSDISKTDTNTSMIDSSRETTTEKTNTSVIENTKSITDTNISFNSTSN